MAKIKKHIEIIRSEIPVLSSMSWPSSDALQKVLRRHYSSVGISIINTMSDLHKLVEKRPDLVFVGLKFIPLNRELGINDPEKIWITKFLDDNDIAYTGSNHLAHNLESDKSLAKQRVIDAGIASSDFFVKYHNNDILQPMPIDYPVFIKPTNRGGGQGIDSNSIADNYEQLSSKILSLATTLNCDVLVEEYLDGREFSVAILKEEYSSEHLTMPLELIAPIGVKGERILSAAVKSSDTETFIGVTDLELKFKICTLAINVFWALGARDYGRIDIRMDSCGVPHFLEANLIPSLIEDYGNFPKACWLNEGIGYEQMVLRIVNLGFNRLPTEDEEDESILGLMPIPLAV